MIHCAISLRLRKAADPHLVFAGSSRSTLTKLACALMTCPRCTSAFVMADAVALSVAQQWLIKGSAII
jgi:hypothetical protein